MAVTKKEKESDGKKLLLCPALKLAFSPRTFLLLFTKKN